MKNLFLITSMLLATFIMSCNRSEKDTPENKIVGTWKLEGIVNEKTGEMQVLEPKDCEECYTLKFETNTTGTGRSTTNQMWINLNKAIFMGNMTEINESTDDGHFFISILHSLISYEFNENTLKFYYQYENNTYYLLYKKLQQ
jgi:hypothetical protein